MAEIVNFMDRVPHAMRLENKLEVAFITMYRQLTPGGKRKTEQLLKDLHRESKVNAVIEKQKQEAQSKCRS